MDGCRRDLPTRCFVVTPLGAQASVRAYLADYWPEGVSPIFIDERVAGTEMKQEILEDVAPVAIFSPGTGGLSLLFALLRSLGIDSERKVLVLDKNAHWERLISMGDPDEVQEVRRLMAERQLISADTLSYIDWRDFLGAERDADKC